jgi:hypothetical protein
MRSLIYIQVSAANQSLHCVLKLPRALEQS